MSRRGRKEVIKKEEVIEKEIEEVPQQVTQQQEEEEEKDNIVILSLRRRLRRPNFTEDEETQIKNDFTKFDVLNEGKIKPSTILLFAEKEGYAETNPFYYQALKNLNSEDNNTNGITVDDFMNAVRRVIKDYNEDFDNWKDIFNRFVDGSKGKKQIIDKETMAETIKNMGFKVNDEDIQELIGKMDGDLDETKFCDIMRYVETRFQRMQRRK
jgi:Ca2+-binding EF-hand superfamily protein